MEEGEREERGEKEKEQDGGREVFIQLSFTQFAKLTRVCSSFSVKSSEGSPESLRLL